MKSASTPDKAVPDVEQAPAASRFAALRSRNFATLWLAGIVSNAGAQMQSVAKIWLVIQRTDSPLALAINGLCFAIPMTILPLLGGALADRIDRIALLKITQTLMVLQPLGLALLLTTGHAPLWLLYVDTAFSTVVYAINSPAQQALVPALVPRQDVQSATALQSAIWTGARLVGPALGGLLLIPLGAAWLFAINGLTTLAVLAALFALRDLPKREPLQSDTKGFRGSGIRYAWSHAAVRAILGLTAGLTLLQGAYFVLLPFFARDTWHVGSQGYGFLLSATGLGALIGTFGLAALVDLRRKAAIAGGCSVIVCIALIGFAHAPIYTIGLALLVLVEIATAIANALLATLPQLLVPDALRGRVLALRSIAFIGLGDFGGLLAAALAQGIGAATALTGSALALLVVVPFAIRPLDAESRGGEAGR